MVRNLIVAAALAATAIAMPQGPSTTTTTLYNPWAPVVDPTTSSWTEWTTTSSSASCTPTWEAYVCDGDDGAEYTTTFAVYPTYCPEYTSWSDWTPEATSTSTWSAWTTTTPYDPWVAVADPTTSTWSEWATTTTTPYEPWVAVANPTTSTWSEWATTTTTAAAPTWSAYEEEIITITFIATWVQPGPKGWETKTSTIYTTYDENCTETPKPAKPTKPASKTYTTTCPESWGVGKTVTVTVPYAQWTPEAASASSTGTWATWSSAATPEAATTSIWASWSTYSTPEAASTSSSASWVAYNGSSPAGASASWAAIGAYHGAAVSNGVSQIMVVAAGAVAALAFYL